MIQGLSLHFFQEREHLRVQHRARSRQRYRAAIIVGMELRLDIFSAGIIGGVHVGNKAQRFGIFLPRGGGQCGIYIAVLVHMSIGQAQFFQFSHQLVCQIKLTGRAGMRSGIRVRSGIYSNIIEQTFVSTHEICFLLKRGASGALWYIVK